jgi:alpha-beta hydrolase superfamily lysophospholipase
MNVKFSIAAMLLSVLLVVRPADCGARTEMDRAMAATLEGVRSSLAPLDVTAGKAASYPEPVPAYFAYYGLAPDGVDHRFGTFRSGRHTIAAHVFRPARSRATVIVAHGYYDHAGVWRHAIHHLIEQGYTVAVYDQPGHGLSSGSRASISAFSQYVMVLRDFVALCRRELAGPYHIVAHSMGGAVTADYLLNTEDAPVDRVVLLAPLVRSAAWTASGAGHLLVGGVLESVPRTFRKNTSNREFQAFQRRDPLQGRAVPMQWVGAHRDWVKAFEDYGTSEKRIVVIQGNCDTTVSWKYNLRALKGKFPKMTVHMVEDAGHQLMNERADLRAKAFGALDAALEPPPESGGDR